MPFDKDKIKKFTEKKLEYNKIKDIEDDPDIVEKRFILEQSLDIFSKTIILNVFNHGTFEKNIEFINKYLSNGFSKAGLANILTSAIDNLSAEAKKPFYEISNSKLSNEEKIDLLIKEREKLSIEDKSIFDDEFNNNAANHYKISTNSFSSDLVLDKFLNDSLEFYNDLDDIIPNIDNVFVNAFDDPSIADGHPYEGKINEMIKKLDPVNDKEYIDILKGANELIIYGKSSFVDQQSYVAERTGMSIDEMMVQKQYNYALTNTNFKDYLIRTTRFINFSNDVPSEYKEKAISNIIKTTPNMSIEYKEKIKEIFNYAKEAGIFTGVSSGEQTVKRYSMDKLVLENEKLKNAIDSGNKELIIKAYKDNLAIRNKYDTLLDMCHKLNDKNVFVSNVSSSRVPDVPSKYRNDMLGVSRLNAFSILNSLLEETNTSLDEMLDDPAKTIVKITKNAARSNNVSNTYMKTHSIDEIFSEYNKFAMGTLYRNIAKDVLPITLLQRAINSFMLIYPDEKIQTELNAKLILLQQQYSAKICECQAAFQMGANDKNIELFLKNLLVCEPKDRTFYDQLPENEMQYNVLTRRNFTPFNHNEYMGSGKTKLSGVILRIHETLKNYEEKFPNDRSIDIAFKVCKNLATELKAQATNSPSYIKDALDNLETGHYEDLTRKDIQMLTINNGLPNNNQINNIDNFKNGINAFKEYKNAYESRNIFAKIFLPSAWRERSAIRNFKNEYINNGISNEELTTLLDNRSEENQINNIYDNINDRLVTVIEDTFDYSEEMDIDLENENDKSFEIDPLDEKANEKFLEEINI